MAEYRNVAHYNDTAFEWDPVNRVFSGGIESTAPGYLPMLMQYRDMVLAGTAKDYEAEQYRNWEAEARAIPTRDIASLTPGWQGDLQGQWTDNGWQAGSQDWWKYLDPLSPDVGPIVLGIRDKIDAGTASPQERQLFEGVMAMGSDWDYRASVPQASDALSPFGDNLLSALGVLGIGATGGLAAAPLFAGGAGLATTLGSLGSLAGVAGTGAGVLGQATDQPWLQNFGLGLGIAGGLAGGLGGLSNLWSSGVNSLSDAAKLAQSAGKITGSLGRIPGADPLKDVSRYLGYAGQAGQFGAGLGADDWLGWSGTNSPSAANALPQVGSNVSNLLSAADLATQRGGGSMADDWGSTDWLDWSGGGQGPLLSDAGPGIDWSSFTAGGPGSWAGQETTDFANGGGGGFWGSLLSGLGGLAKSALPTAAKAGLGGAAGTAATSGWLGPLLSSLGSVGGGAIGSNAANEAARLQAAALNRGIDLSEAQWLQQQARTQPWVQAGQQSLSTLQGLAGQQLPGLPGATPGISGANYALPGTTPGWSPQAYQGPQGPNAADYRYSAPATVDPSQYAWNPQAAMDPSQYAWNPQAAMDPSQYAFSATNGQELLARDPGYQFRQDEARKAIDASAAARGGLLSGSTLGALQRQSQDLASQEYGQAYGRALGENQLRYGRGLTQTQEDYQRQLAANQLRYGRGLTQTQEDYQRQLQANQLGYGRATEQQQLGYQQGLGAQGFNWQTALQGQQNQFNQGLTAQQWEQQQRQKYETDMYQRMLEQQKMRYGMDVNQNATDYERQQALYKQQLAQSLLPWEQNSTLASLGAQVTGQLGNQGIASSSGISNLLGQLGSSQALGTLGSAGQWNQAIAGGVGGLQNILRGLNA